MTEIETGDYIMTFAKWFETFIQEKGVDAEQVVCVDGPSGENYIPLQFVFDAIKSTGVDEQNAIKKMIIKIDFVNGDVVDYFKHLAQAIAI